MKRTNSQWCSFLKRNRPFLWLVGLVLCGCLCGVLLFENTDLLQMLGDVLPLSRVEHGFSAALFAWCSACFQTGVLLLLLFLSGFSACGAPVPVFVLLFWGIGLGMTETYYYSRGGLGVLFTVAVVLPPAIVQAAALLMASVESMRMSLRLFACVFSRTAHGGSLHKEWRLYAVRFLIFTVLILFAGVLDVVLRLLLFDVFSL